MSVYDKELVINGKAVRSPEQQVYKNMKDIEELQKSIKPMYKTTTSLTSSSVTVSLATTNVGDETSGWLIDPNGLLFKITGNDGTNVLIQYYSDLKGPQGESGSELYIDDNSTGNADKVYSQVYIRQIINNGLWYSTTQPAGSPLIINVTSIVMNLRNTLYCQNTIQQGDMFFYVDGDGKAKELYKINDITSGVATVEKVCDIGGGGSLTIPIITILASQQETSVLPDINYVLTQEQIDAFNNNNVVEVILPDGTDFLYQANITSDTTQWGIKVFSKVIVGTDATGDYASSKSLVFITDNITINETTMRSGKQLYQHNIYFKDTSNNIGGKLTIINDNNELINTGNKLANYLYEKGYITKEKSLLINGRWATNTETYSGIFATQDSSYYIYVCNVYNGNLSEMRASGDFNVEDYVISL